MLPALKGVPLVCGTTFTWQRMGLRWRNRAITTFRFHAFSHVSRKIFYCPNVCSQTLRFLSCCCFTNVQRIHMCMYLQPDNRVWERMCAALWSPVGHVWVPSVQWLFITHSFQRTLETENHESFSNPFITTNGFTCARFSCNKDVFELCRFFQGMIKCCFDLVYI